MGAVCAGLPSGYFGPAAYGLCVSGWTVFLVRQYLLADDCFLSGLYRVQYCAGILLAAAGIEHSVHPAKKLAAVPGGTRYFRRGRSHPERYVHRI